LSVSKEARHNEREGNGQGIIIGVEDSLKRVRAS
jgi:hypothetical protein